MLGQHTYSSLLLPRVPQTVAARFWRLDGLESLSCVRGAFVGSHWLTASAVACIGMRERCMYVRLSGRWMADGECTLTPPSPCSVNVAFLAPSHEVLGRTFQRNLKDGVRWMGK